METFAYIHLSAAYEEAEIGIEYHLREFSLNWKQLPSSAWLGLLGVAFVCGSLNDIKAANAAQYYVNTNGSCLNVRYGPSKLYRVYNCVRNGAALAPVIGHENGFAKLATGRYVAEQYISTEPGSGSSPGGVGGAYLRRGSTGSAVQQVQKALGVKPTGYYGSVTERAVRNFQAKNKLLVDGVVGAQTRRVLGV
ncbi:MAG TPA: peptidoglycan-binding domain-containing protein [Candidatus Obscuribacterales bacterium]